MAHALLVFLGNPGTEYRKTRHNAAWRLLETATVADLHPAWQEKFSARFAAVRAPDGRQIILLQPQTFMNRVGQSVGRAVSFYKLAPEQLTVAHDDTELGFGSWEYRLGGGLAGHNGLRSVAEALGTKAFGRFRIGIGRPTHGALRGHVLGRFSAEEEVVLTDTTPAIAEDLLRALLQNA